MLIEGSTNSIVRAIAVQPDGKVLVSGDFIGINGQTRNKIARLNADGTFDTAFNPIVGGGVFVNAIALQPDGKILLGGGFSTINGGNRSGIGRINANGTTDTTFRGEVGSGGVNTIALQPDGKILVGGNFTIIGGQPRNRLARLNADGTANSFDPNATNSGFSPSFDTITLQPDGKILVSGFFTAIGGQSINLMSAFLETERGI